MDYRVYTDGSCNNNDGVGGCYAVVVDRTEERLLLHGGGGRKGTTSNQMELAAILVGLSLATSLVSTHLPGTCTVQVISDSSYAIHSIRDFMPKWKANGWVTSTLSPVANRVLLEAIDTAIAYLAERFEVSVVFAKVKGHGTTYWNNYVDTAAGVERARLRDRGSHD